jgi:hypothetical protein
MKWMSVSTKRQCDRALAPPPPPLRRSGAPSGPARPQEAYAGSMPWRCSQATSGQSSAEGPHSPAKEARGGGEGGVSWSQPQCGRHLVGATLWNGWPAARRAHPCWKWSGRESGA